MAKSIPLTWKLRSAQKPSSGTNQVDGFNPSRLVKISPSAGGPDGSDADINTKVTYNEGLPNVTEYFVEETVAAIILLANADPLRA